MLMLIEEEEWRLKAGQVRERFEVPSRPLVGWGALPMLSVMVS
jgi:hypothetical protein